MTGGRYRPSRRGGALVGAAAVVVVVAVSLAAGARPGPSEDGEEPATVHGALGRASLTPSPSPAASTSARATAAGGSTRVAGGTSLPRGLPGRSTAVPGGTAEAGTAAQTGGASGGRPQPATPAIRVAVAGDVHFEGAAGRRLAADPATAVGPMARTLAAADLAVVNLETAVTSGGVPAAKQYVFRAPASAFTALRAAGIDVATMANNHGMDYGVAGLQDSLRAAHAAGFPTVGIGTDDTTAYAPYIATVRGQRIAVFGATQVIDDELVAAWTAGPGKPGLASAKQVARLAAAIRRVRPAVDAVLVYLHWGVEHQQCPSRDQADLVAPLAAAGADAIVGGHAHVLEGAGWNQDGVYVDYGLGNFVFYASGGGPSTQTGVLELTFHGRQVTAADWVSGHIVDAMPQPLTGAAAQDALRRWNGLRACTGLSDSVSR